MIRIMILFTLLFVSGISHAIDSEGKYLIYPAGTATCDEFLADNAQGQISMTVKGLFIPDILATYVGYIEGYLTAVNRTVGGKHDHFNEAKVEDVMTWVAAYCKAKSTDNLNKAVSAYVDQFMRKKEEQKKDK